MKSADLAGCLSITGRPAMALGLRLPLQLFWIGALWWFARAA
jgi:hypothetical protein